MTTSPTNPTPDELTCRDVADFIMSYLDNELATSVQKSFSDHLAVCSSCVRYVEHYRRTIEMAKAAGKGIEDVAVPPSVLRAIREARSIAS
ncbi:hypothetical protein LBMAG48_22890 [Phycisphaerae bacterium]|jgi:anti-sigma factor RsiW|nr:hypothetical protein LBMAG48_22890 [Phycisphaerae bacterium]